MVKESIYNFTRKELEEYLLNNNQKKFRATQIFEGIYRNEIDDFENITTLSKDAKQFFRDNFYFPNFKIKDKKTSADETTKYLFELEDENLIETVLMPHDYGYSVCVTTQVGCNMGCKFCASGILKRVRNLTASEIVLQILLIQKELTKINKKVSNVVVMGIGEPFDNYDNVLKFVEIINDAKGLEIGARHITISTCGLIPKILEFSEFPLQVNLAVSLHFPNNRLRDEFMPINKKYKLEELMKTLNVYFSKTGRRITFEYILLDSINDSLDCAKELVSLVKGTNCYINLIPYNETNGIFKRSSPKAKDEFFDYLVKHGVNTIVRREFGLDIDAACGQLRAKKMMENK